jgi:capsular exopolysaccharide synthesis family protein
MHGSDSVDLRRVLGSGLRWAPFVALAIVLLAVPAFLYGAAQPRLYEASATLSVGQGVPTFNSVLVSEQLSRFYAYRATTRPILEEVIESQGLGVRVDELQERVDARPAPETALLTVSARDRDPETAAAIANEVAALLQREAAAGPTSTIARDALERDLAALRTEISAVEEQIAALAAQPPDAARDAQLAAAQDRLVERIAAHADLLQVALGSGAHALQLIVPAVPPADPVEPRPVFLALQAGLLGLLIAGAIAFVVEYLDDRPRQPRDVEVAVGAPLLATIEELRGDIKRGPGHRLIALTHPRSPSTEGYRRLRANLEFMAGDDGLRSLLVAGVEGRGGTAVVAANLAVAFAQVGRRVLLVDADLREPGLHELFDVPSERGLVTLLGSPGMTPEAVAHRTPQPGLLILPSGPLPADPAQVVASERMRETLAALSASQDLLVVVGPPLPATSDTAILASLTRAVLVVLETNRVERESLSLARDEARLAGASMLGAVVYRTRRGAHPQA